MDQQLVRQLESVKDYIDTNIQGVNRVQDLVEHFKLDRRLMGERFKVVYGISPKRYIQKKKLALLNAAILKYHDGFISFYYAHEIGLNSSPALYNLVRRETGLTFQKYKAKLLAEAAVPNEI